MIEIKQHFCYLRAMRISVFALVVLLLWGCSKLPEAPESVEPLQDLQFEFLQYANKLYFAAEVQPEYLGNSLDSVEVLWYGTQLSPTADAVQLNDFGTDGDIISNDGIYSRKISNTNLDLMNFIPDTAKGKVYLEFRVFYVNEIITFPDSFYLANIRPDIIEISAPETITRPSGATLAFEFVTATVNDANGLSDIKLVGFTSFHIGPDTLLFSGNPILLFDDGGDVVLYSPNITSGDEVKGDGIYSFNIPIYGTGYTDPVQATKTGTFRWTFIVRDKSDEYGNEIIHGVVVQ